VSFVFTGVTGLYLVTDCRFGRRSFDTVGVRTYHQSELTTTASLRCSQYKVYVRIQEFAYVSPILYLHTFLLPMYLRRLLTIVLVIRLLPVRVLYLDPSNRRTKSAIVTTRLHDADACRQIFLSPSALLYYPSSDSNLSSLLFSLFHQQV
jgi:hypothetical protein